MASITEAMGFACVDGRAWARSNAVGVAVVSFRHPRAGLQAKTPFPPDVRNSAWLWRVTDRVEFAAGSTPARRTVVEWCSQTRPRREKEIKKSETARRERSPVLPRNAPIDVIAMSAAVASRHHSRSANNSPHLATKSMTSSPRPTNTSPAVTAATAAAPTTTATGESPTSLSSLMRNKPVPPCASHAPMAKATATSPDPRRHCTSRLQLR